MHGVMKKPVLLFLAGFLVACSDGKQSSNVAGSNAEQYASVDKISLDPCAIVLTPLELPERDDPIVRYQQAILRSSSPIAYLEKLGWAFVSKARRDSDPGYYRLAEQSAQCIEQRTPGSPEALLLKGHALHNLHRFSEAEVMARKLVEQRGLWLEYGLLGDVLMEQGQLGEAAGAYQTMMDQRPGPQAYSRAAHLRWLRGDLAGAIKMMKMTVQAVGSRATEAAAWAEIRLGLYLFQSGDSENAWSHIDQALSLQHGYAPALLAAGRLHLAQGDLAEAVKALKHAARMNPLPEYQWLLIEALYANQQPDQAMKIELQLHKKGAVEDRRTYALYLASARKHLVLAEKLARQELAKRADIFSFDAMAWALYALNRPAEALQHIERATAEGTQDARLFFHAAMINKAVGNASQATDWYIKAKAVEHMLLPSESAALDTEFAAIMSQTLALVSSDAERQNLHLEGGHHEYYP